MKVDFVQMHRLSVLFSTVFMAILMGYIWRVHWPFDAIRSFIVAMQILNALYGFVVLDFHLTMKLCDTFPILRIPTFLFLTFIGGMYCYTLSHVISWLSLWGKSMAVISVSVHLSNEVVIFTASEIMIMCAGWVALSIVYFIINSYLIFVRPFSNK